MKEELKHIYKAFNGKLVGTYAMKVHVCETVAGMPEEIIEKVTKNCWFLGSMDEAWAFTFTGNDLKDMHLIFISDELLLQEESEIHYTIAHEIGHVVLEHRNSTLVKQSKSEIKEQEEDADAFAQKYA